MLTRQGFRQHAKPISVVINGVAMTAIPKEFSTGSVGWNINGKLPVSVNGDTVNCQVGFNLTVVDSKKLPPG